MDVFALRQHLIEDYSRFARSFTTIRAEDLRQGVDDAYASGSYWPEPLIQINPRYLRGRTSAELVATGELHPFTAQYFPIDLYRHQEQAVEFHPKLSHFRLRFWWKSTNQARALVQLR